VNVLEAAPPHPLPSHCPFCRATTIRTASEKADTASYWRCERCGEVWNVARLSAGSGDRGRRLR
jgi:transposase-like protein